MGAITDYVTARQAQMKSLGSSGTPAPMGSPMNPWRTPGGQPGDWFSGRPGQFGHPQPQQLPGNIDEIRGQMQKYQNQPTDWQNEFNRMNPGFTKQWQGVFNLPDPNPNVGPQVASAPLGEGAGPSAPWGGWQPAQEEGWAASGGGWS